MANWANTSYTITGSREEVTILYGIMHTLSKMDKPFVENGWGSCWLGCLVSILGGDTKKIYCSGQWNHDEGIIERGEETALSFSTETAWERCTDMERLIREKFPSLQIYYLEEEPGMGIYQTNDIENRFFRDEVKVYFEDGDEDYYDSDYARTTIGDYLGLELRNWEECKDEVDRWNRKCDEDNTDKHIYIHELEYVSC